MVSKVTSHIKSANTMLLLIGVVGATIGVAMEADAPTLIMPIRGNDDI